MEISSETPAKRSKRLTSVVWNHFERVRKGEICYAVCVHCKKKLSGSSNSGTTHLRNHLLRCLKRSDVDVSQIIAAKRKRKDSTLCVTNVAYEEGQRKEEIVRPLNFKFDHDPKKEESNLPVPVNIGCVKFEQERSRLDLARMIMLHGYPMAMVDHVGFKIFVKNLQPFFEFVTNSAIELDCMTIYAKEKQKIYETIHNLHGRISLAAEIWASTDNTRYLCLTAHYIDEDWKLQKKILNFITLDVVNADDLLSEVVIKCLTDWAIDRKLFSMTFDDFSEKEWEWASSVTGYVKLFVEVTNVFAGNKYLTPNIYFPEICDIHIQLTEWCRSTDDFLGDIARKMKAKFDLYWSKCSLSLAIAAILDPRFKMKLVEYYYPQIYGSDASNHIKNVSNAIRELFNEYATDSTSLDQEPLGQGSSPSTCTGTRDRLRGFDKFLNETSQTQSVASDLVKAVKKKVVGIYGELIISFRDRGSRNICNRYDYNGLGISVSLSAILSSVSEGTPELYCTHHPPNRLLLLYVSLTYLLDQSQ
nr:zinc finger BED domain-containing protein RICESLEEPER 1-like [Ipomoea trifida]